MSDFCPECIKEGVTTKLIYQRFKLPITGTRTPMVEDPAGGKRCPRCFYEPKKGDEQMGMVPEQTLVLKMSDGDLEGMHKVIRESMVSQETRLMSALEDFKHITSLLSDQILDLKRRIDTMEKWVENKRECGL